MATEQGGAVDEQALRAQWLKESRYKHFPTVAKIEEPADRVFVSKYEGDDVRFRKWTQGQVDYMFNLPFYEKIAAKAVLEPGERVRWDALKRSMVELALVEKGRWSGRLGDPRFVDGMFYVIQNVSGLDDAFGQRLEEFFDSEIGRVYGNIWFGLMGMDPERVGKLPPAAYSAVMTWASKWVKHE